MEMSDWNGPMVSTILITYFGLALIVGMLMYLDSDVSTAQATVASLLWPGLLIPAIRSKLLTEKLPNKSYLLEADVKHHLGPYTEWAVVHAPTLAEAESKFKRRILDLPENTPLYHVTYPIIEITNHTIL